MNLDKVTVVVPCYNQAKYLDEALQSIVNQTHGNWECIIVNDGSPDNTEQIAQHYVEKDVRFKYFYKENGGLSSARNFGIEKSNSNFILTLDSDDKYDSSFMEKALVIFEQNSEIGVVSSWISRFKDDKEIAIIKPNGKTIEDFLFQNACNGTSLFRKKCWLEVGGYDENMKNGYEDWDFYIRVCSFGWQVYVIPEPLFYYRQHTFSMRLDAYANHDVAIKKYLYSKHKVLYLNHYDKMIGHFLHTIDLEKRNVLKTKNKIDYKLGSFILKPLRMIKSIIKWR
ncbi:glycosyltransferase family 2 protein [Flavobacterium sp.]|jgi:glycosyltransferase involved in cell wall biosynthesis|uniref:glycosyltransferase family 2 protein n=1 Tax=Flavobacterium sp. TaxID=239 RepID=UPI0037C13FD9